MNDDFFRYKIRFFTFALLLGYAIIHTHLTGTYADVSLSMQIDFIARMPFGQRVLVPALALRDWLTGNSPLYFEPDGIVSLINRYVVIGVLLFVAVFHQLLNNGLLWLLTP